MQILLNMAPLPVSRFKLRRVIEVDTEMLSRKERTPRVIDIHPTLTATLTEILIEKQCQRMERTVSLDTE